MNDQRDEEIIKLATKYKINNTSELRQTLSLCEIFYEYEAQNEYRYDIYEITDQIDEIRMKLVELHELIQSDPFIRFTRNDELDNFISGIDSLINIRDDLINKLMKRTVGRPKNTAEEVTVRLLAEFWINSLGRKFVPYFQQIGPGRYQAKAKSDVPEANPAQFIVDAVDLVAKHATLPPEHERRIPNIGSLRKTVESVRRTYFPETIKGRTQRS
ncbi:hypothetical protein [Azospirillum sp. Marseille-Q6669]